MNDIELRDEQPETLAVAFVDTHEPAPDPHQEEREKAFDAVYSWDGRPLEPFTSGRRREWARMRAFEGADPSFLDDAVKILWLCFQPADALIAKRRDLQSLCAECWRWADDNIAHDRHGDLLSLVDKMLTDSEANRAVPIPSDGAAPGN